MQLETKYRDIKSLTEDEKEIRKKAVYFMEKISSLLYLQHDAIEIFASSESCILNLHDMPNIDGKQKAQYFIDQIEKEIENIFEELKKQ